MSGREYELMHMDVRVADIELDVLGDVRLARVHDLDHMPVGTVVSGRTDGICFRGWWSHRCIPMQREGVSSLLDAAGVGYTTELLPGSLALSLSDRYWIRPSGLGITWDDVNLFDNPFPGDIGDILIGL